MAESSSVVFASFFSRVRGIRFYDVSTSGLSVGRRVVLQLELTNAFDSDCMAVYLQSSFFSDMLGHLAREDAALLAPLLRSGMFATGQPKRSLQQWNSLTIE